MATVTFVIGYLFVDMALGACECVGVTRPSADPHLPPSPFGVRGGKSRERKPRGEPRGQLTTAGRKSFI